MLVYGLDVAAAQRKISNIRAVLGKQRRQAILIPEFCNVENVDRKIFEAELQTELNKLYNKPRTTV